MLRGASVTLELTSAAGVPVGADGEPLPALAGGTTGGGTLRAEVLPGALSLLH